MHRAMKRKRKREDKKEEGQGETGDGERKYTTEQKWSLYNLKALL